MRKVDNRVIVVRAVKAGVVSDEADRRFQPAFDFLRVFRAEDSDELTGQGRAGASIFPIKFT